MNLTRSYKTTIAALSASVLVATNALSHDVVVHKRIADSAARAASGLARFLKDNLGRDASDPAKAPKLDGKTPLEWIVEGAEREDDNPLSNSGLMDYSIFVFFFGAVTPPVNSQSWATLQGNSGPGGPNQWTWQGARTRQYNALTDQSKSSREQSFGKMFRSLGQATHLIADLSQPGHTRNDAHGLDALKNFLLHLLNVLIFSDNLMVI